MLPPVRGELAKALRQGIPVLKGSEGELDDHDPGLRQRKLRPSSAQPSTRQASPCTGPQACMSPPVCCTRLRFAVGITMLSAKGAQASVQNLVQHHFSFFQLDQTLLMLALTR